jgi:hypothetical protein
MVSVNIVLMGLLLGKMGSVLELYLIAKIMMIAIDVSNAILATILIILDQCLYALMVNMAAIMSMVSVYLAVLHLLTIQALNLARSMVA